MEQLRVSEKDASKRRARARVHPILNTIGWRLKCVCANRAHTIELLVMLVDVSNNAWWVSLSIYSLGACMATHFNYSDYYNNKKWSFFINIMFIVALSHSSPLHLMWIEKFNRNSKFSLVPLFPLTPIKCALCAMPALCLFLSHKLKWN